MQRDKRDLYSYHYGPRPRARSTPPPARLTARGWRRSRVFALLAVLILCLLYYHHHTPASTVLDTPYAFDSVDWSRYAYSQYATDSAYLCNSIMVFEALHRLSSRAERILFYPDDWDLQIFGPTDRDSQLLVLARDKYKVKLFPVKMHSIKRSASKDQQKKEEATWDRSINKFLAWNQTQYDRILHLDSDITLLQNLDELFFLPKAQIAMPRAYWDLPTYRSLTSLLVVLEPSTPEYDALMGAAYASESPTGEAKFDMELLNNRFRDSALVLPHRGYGLLTGEFRSKEHGVYLGNAHEKWDPDAALREAKLVHFSDWPLPKPWVMWPQQLLAEMLPKCDSKPGTAEESGCRDRELWRKLYDDFRQRRKDICALLSAPAPDWPPRSKAG